jgi:hypothetical protein
LQIGYQSFNSSSVMLDGAKSVKSNVQDDENPFEISFGEADKSADDSKLNLSKSFHSENGNEISGFELQGGLDPIADEIPEQGSFFVH